MSLIRPFTRELRRHLILAAVAAVALRLFFIWRFPAEAGDTAIYEQLARNWLDHGVYGLWVEGRLTPADLRAPGYPAFLAVLDLLFGRHRLAVMLVQAVLDTATCVLAAGLAARFANWNRKAAIVALWLAALCPFTANYTAAVLTETLSIFLTALAMLVFLDAWADPQAPDQGTYPGRKWFLGGFLTGLGTLVRPETPLLLFAIGLVLAARWRCPRDWTKLWRAGLWMAFGLVLPLLPWAARNWHTLGSPQFLATRYAEMPGEFVPKGFYDWTRTWLYRYDDLYRSLWKLDEEPIRIEDLPAAAFDSAAEREQVATLLAQYNQDTTMTPERDAAFERLARERTARHPLRTYLGVPLRRAVTIWFHPRIELLPYSGKIWPLSTEWDEDREDLLVTLGFGLLNVIYVMLAAAGAWRFRHSTGVAFAVSFLLVRTVLLTQVESPEPRYLLVGFPMLLALASLALAGKEGHRGTARLSRNQR